MMIFKEAMSNCLKHAQASHVKLKVHKSDIPEIEIVLADDGLGFNPLYIKKGHGFQNMRKARKPDEGFLYHKQHPGEGAPLRTAHTV